MIVSVFQAVEIIIFSLFSGDVLVKKHLSKPKWECIANSWEYIHA